MTDNNKPAEPAIEAPAAVPAAATPEEVLHDQMLQELKKELKAELEQELRQELIVSLGREISFTGREMAHRVRKGFFPTEKEALVKQLNKVPLLKAWDVRFSDAQTLTEVEEQLVKGLRQEGRAHELRLQCGLVKNFRFSKRKKMAADFMLVAIARLENELALAPKAKA